MSWVARWRPVLKRFSPLITHSSPSRTAVVSSQVASEPWSGSVSPNAMRISPVIIPSRNSSFCSGVPNSSIISTVGKLPTIDDSFCRSLCRPRPFAARCSRMIAIAEVRAVLTAQLASAARSGRRPAASARRRISPSSSSHSLRGTPPFSQSVRAYSRRWSKNRMLSSCCSSGLISPSMKASSSRELVPDVAGDLEVHGGSPD